jgi:hypothetical protein
MEWGRVMIMVASRAVRAVLQALQAAAIADTALALMHRTSKGRWPYACMRALDSRQ